MLIDSSRNYLSILKDEHLLREIPQISTDVINLCSNDYLGISRHPLLIEAILESLKDCGAGSTGSRLVSGNTKYHTLFERKIREFFSLKDSEDVLLFNSGYCANIGVIPVICRVLGDGDCAIFSDELNHASLIDGIRLSKSKRYIYKHNDVEHLETLLTGSKEKNKLIITESLFSMEGDTAPLKEIFSLALKYGASLYIDEAHAFGVWGTEGRGFVASNCSTWNIRENTVVLYTLSKACGVYGAFVIANRNIIDIIRSQARSFIFSTSLPPYIPAAATRSIDIIKNEPFRRQKVKMLSEYASKFLKNKTQIIPVIVGDPKECLLLSERLLQRGFFVQAIRPPSVPRGTSRLRITINANLDETVISRFIKTLKEFGISQ